MVSATSASYRTVETHRTDIVAETALVLANYALIIFLVNDTSLLHAIADPGLHLAVSVLIVLTGSILLLGLIILIAKMRTHHGAKLGHRWKPAIVEVLTRIARGEGSSQELMPFRKRSRDLVEEMVAEALSVQRGAGRDRIAAAAAECAIVARWHRLTESARPEVRCAVITRLGLLSDPASEHEFRKGLDDEEELVALESARALIRTGRPELIEELFLDLPRQTRLVRALLCQWLIRHTFLLAPQALPAALRSEDPVKVIAALEAIASWRRALPLHELKPLLSHTEPAIREAAWQVLPYAMGVEVTPEELGDAVSAAEPAVRRAAWEAVSRLKMASAASRFPDALLDPHPDAALAAARAAASLGLRRDLERTAVTSTGMQAASAMEVLEKSMMGRLER